MIGSDLYKFCTAQDPESTSSILNCPSLLVIFEMAFDPASMYSIFLLKHGFDASDQDGNGGCSGYGCPKSFCNNICHEQT